MKPETIEEAMNDDIAGRRWTVTARYDHPITTPDPDDPSRVRINFSEQTADSYSVCHCRNFSIHRGDFATQPEASAYADELNRLDVQGPIRAEFVERRKRLKELAPYYRSWAYTSQEGPPGARWPTDPDRFLIFDGGVGWHAESWEYLAADKAAIEEHLRGEEANVYRIVDLDTGFDVPFKREIVVTVDLVGPFYL